LESSQGLASPKHQSQVGGTIEDWGVAFEGLPLDSRLYPAVGLYQRDDRVTLLTVESGNRLFGDEITGECYFPRLNGADKQAVEEEKIRVRQHNDVMSWEGIQYAAQILSKAPESLAEEKDDFLISSVLPSLAASLCLIPPSVPLLSARTAMLLSSHLEKCILALEHLRSDGHATKRLFQKGLNGGKWAIRATGASGTAQEHEEYIVDFKVTKDEAGSVIGFEGAGVGTTGKSKNGLVSILGTANGSSVTFVEEWSDGSDDGFNSPSADDASSCVVSARLSLDGNSFEGEYRNVQYGTVGQIAGVRKQNTKAKGSRAKEIPSLSEQFSEVQESLFECEAMLCLAYSHMATILGKNPAGDFEDHGILGSTNQRLHCFLSSSFLSSTALLSSGPGLMKERDILQQFYAPPVPTKEVCGLRCDISMDRISPNQLANNEEVLKHTNISKTIAGLDDAVSKQCGRVGSFSCLCPDGYAAARRSLVNVLVHMCGLNKDISFTENSGVARDQLAAVWCSALQILEDGVRNALAKSTDRATRREVCSSTCSMFCSVSEYLLSLEKLPALRQHMELPEAVHQLSLFYSLIETNADLEYLKAVMSHSTRRGLMRFLALEGLVYLVSVIGNTAVFVECLCVGLPRILGHCQANSSAQALASTFESNNDLYPELSGSCLSGLAGASCCVRAALLTTVCTLSKELGSILSQEISIRDSNSPSEDIVVVDSLTMSILAILVSIVNNAVVSKIVQESGILTCLPKILSAHRAAILWDYRDIVNESEKDSAVKTIQCICHRDISRAIFGCWQCRSTGLLACSPLSFRQESKNTGCGKSELRHIMGLCHRCFVREIWCRRSRCQL